MRQEPKNTTSGKHGRDGYAWGGAAPPSGIAREEGTIATTATTTFRGLSTPASRLKASWDPAQNPSCVENNMKERRQRDRLKVVDEGDAYEMTAIASIQDAKAGDKPAPPKTPSKMISFGGTPGGDHRDNRDHDLPGPQYPGLIESKLGPSSEPIVRGEQYEGAQAKRPSEGGRRRRRI